MNSGKKSSSDKEIFIKDNRLVSEKEWINIIDKITKDSVTVKTKEEALNLLSTYLERAIKKRMENINNFAIFFSGGIDSTIIAFYAKKLGKNFRCYSVGVEKSKDIEWALKIAKHFDFDIKYKIFDIEEAEEIIKKAATIIGPDVVKVGVAAVVIAAFKISKKEKVFFSGLGSEEIFAGYERHALTNDVNAECIVGLKTMWQRDIIRDYTLSKKFGFEIRTPFLDKDLIRATIKIAPQYKIDNQHKKIILREFAELKGIPKEFAWRKKVAAQYGSGFDK
ncbi:MAG: asparagine synthase C-terminal domain-containing protein, partial [Candidatus Woesearchaeota archaeon]